MQNQNIVGLSVCLLKNKEIVFTKGYGLTDKVGSVASEDKSLYRLGYLSMPFSATLALLLQEQGRLHLDSQVQKYVPEYPLQSQGEISIRQLLSHSSGIRHYTQYSLAEIDTFTRTYSRYDPIAALEVFKSGSLADTPGRATRFSSFAYNLLGAVIERAGPVSYAEQLRVSLGISNALPLLQAEYKWKKPFWNRARGYIVLSNGATIPSQATADPIWKLPAEGMLGSVIDYGVYLERLLKNQLFSSSLTLNRMLTEQNVQGDPSGYSLGWKIKEIGGNKIAYLDSKAELGSGIVLFNSINGNGVVILSNTENRNLESLADRLYTELAFASAQTGSFQNLPSLLTTPDLLFPLDGQRALSTQANLKWNPVECSSSYIIQWAQDSSFTNPWLDTVNTAEKVLVNLDTNRTYYWKVQAYNPFLHDTARSRYSSTRSFHPGLNTGLVINEPTFLRQYFKNGHWRLSGNEEILTVDLIDIRGRSVLHRKVNDYSLNVFLPVEGIYFLRIQTNRGSHKYKLQY